MNLAELIISIHVMKQTSYLNQLATFRAVEVCNMRNINHDGLYKYIPDESIYFGENIAWKFKDDNSVLKGWLNSPLHKENLLKKEYTRFGIGRNWCKGRSIIILFLSD